LVIYDLTSILEAAETEYEHISSYQFERTSVLGDYAGKIDVYDIPEVHRSLRFHYQTSKSSTYDLRLNIDFSRLTDSEKFVGRLDAEFMVPNKISNADDPFFLNIIYTHLQSVIDTENKKYNFSKKS